MRSIPDDRNVLPEPEYGFNRVGTRQAGRNHRSMQESERVFAIMSLSRLGRAKCIRPNPRETLAGP